MNTLTVALSRGTCRRAESDRNSAVWRLCSPRACENLLHEYGGKARGMCALRSQVNANGCLAIIHTLTLGGLGATIIFTVGEPVIYTFIGNLVAYV